MKKNRQYYVTMDQHEHAVRAAFVAGFAFGIIMGVGAVLLLFG